MKQKKDFLAWEFIFQIQWLGLSLIVLSVVFNLEWYKAIPLAIIIYASKVFDAAEISFLDWKISKLENNK